LSFSDVQDIGEDDGEGRPLIVLSPTVEGVEDGFENWLPDGAAELEELGNTLEDGLTLIPAGDVDGTAELEELGNALEDGLTLLPTGDTEAEEEDEGWTA